MLKKPQDIPNDPGVYIFRDSKHTALYIGKANNLSKRLSSYFKRSKDSTTNLRQASLLDQAVSIEWIITKNEIEALVLERNLIKEHKPKFNIKLKDDKTYPYISITTKQNWPSLKISKKPDKKTEKIFGPYPHRQDCRKTFDFLLETFGIRSCSDNKFKQHKILKSPCLLYDMNKCSGPCIGAVSAEKYDKDVQDTIKFLSGNTQAVSKNIRDKMTQSSDVLDFESAARYRDILQSIKKTIQNQAVDLKKTHSADVIALSFDTDTAAAYIFFVRNNMITGQKCVVLEKDFFAEPDDILQKALTYIYTDYEQFETPDLIIVPKKITSLSLHKDWVEQILGKKISIRQPFLSEQKSLLELGQTNAARSLQRNRLNRLATFDDRKKALLDLQQALGLSRAPLRIECYDAAHLQGTNYVGSMVVMTDGVLDKKQYRKFSLRQTPQNDDYGALKEIVSRRLKHIVDKTEKASFSKTPDLLLVDGGQGQLGVVVQLLKEYGLEKTIFPAALAKKLEKVYTPNHQDPVDLFSGTKAHLLLTLLRDESHRVANSFHKNLRTKDMLSSDLDNIKGLGPVRRQKLFDVFVSFEALSNASLEDLEKLGFLPKKVAYDIFTLFHN